MAFDWMDRGKEKRKTSVRIVGFPCDIRTQHLLKKVISLFLDYARIFIRGSHGPSQAGLKALS
jgi:hypothetical protein